VAAQQQVTTQSDDLQFRFNVAIVHGEEGEQLRRQQADAVCAALEWLANHPEDRR
jgi:hypothetical protein